MRNKYAVKIMFLLVIQALCLYSASAKAPGLVVPNRNQIMIVGRIVLKNDINREFYARSFGVSAEASHVYVLPIVACQGCKSVAKTENYIDLGDYFFKTYTIPDDNVFKFDGCMMYLFNKQDLMMGIPLRISCPIPPHVNYLYIGTYEIDVANDDFTIKSIKLRDEYDLAKEELQRLVGNKATLYRGYVSQDQDKRYESQFRMFINPNIIYTFTLD